MSLAFGSEASLTDIDMDYDNPAFSFSGTIVDMQYVIQAIVTFRPYIRGFTLFLLALYSVNQFLNIIGQGSLSLGALLRLNGNNGGDGDDN